VEIEKVATPVPVRTEVPIWTVPSSKATVPVGVPATDGVTFTVNAMVWFRFAAMGVMLNATLVLAFCTI
jgi:hypothetical protein